MPHYLFADKALVVCIYVCHEAERIKSYVFYGRRGDQNVKLTKRNFV
jgi:hypothetical protein